MFALRVVVGRPSQPPFFGYPTSNTHPHGRVKASHDIQRFTIETSRKWGCARSSSSRCACAIASYFSRAAAPVPPGRLTRAPIIFSTRVGGGRSAVRSVSSYVMGISVILAWMFVCHVVILMHKIVLLPTVVLDSLPIRPLHFIGGCWHLLCGRRRGRLSRASPVPLRRRTRGLLSIHVH